MKDICDEFGNVVNSLARQRCWSVIAGKGSGSRVGIDIGDKVRRRKPIENPYLSIEQQHFRGKFRLSIEDCAWRLNSATEIICASTSDNANEGPLVRGLQRIVGVYIKSVEFSFPTFDLTVNFSNGLTLYLFCDQCNSFDLANNYSLTYLDQMFVIGTNSQLSKLYLSLPV